MSLQICSAAIDTGANGNIKKAQQLLVGDYQSNRNGWEVIVPMARMCQLVNIHHDAQVQNENLDLATNSYYVAVSLSGTYIPITILFFQKLLAGCGSRLQPPVPKQEKASQ